MVKIKLILSSMIYCKKILEAFVINCSMDFHYEIENKNYIDILTKLLKKVPYIYECLLKAILKEKWKINFFR